MSMIVRLAAVTAALVLAAPAALAQQKTVWRYAHVGAEGESQTRYAAELAKLVNEKTQGRVEIRVFPGSQLGNLSEMVDSVRIGSVQMAHHDFSSLDRFDKDVAVFNAPFAFLIPSTRCARPRKRPRRCCRRSTSAWSRRAACASSATSIAAPASSPRAIR